MYRLLIVSLCSILLQYHVNLLCVSDWTQNALLIQDTLASLTATLAEDAAVFDSIGKEVGHLADIIVQQDAAERDLVQHLMAQFNDLVGRYKDVIQQQQDAQAGNAVVLQNLKIELATLQTSIQNKLDQLNGQNADAQLLFDKLTEVYNSAVADNAQVATDLLDVLRSVCEAYYAMIEKKQVSLDSLNEILTALNNHITNATNDFDLLNIGINQ